MTAEFITTNDPRWTEFLDRTRHDVYHLPGYVEAMARQEGGEPVAFYARSGRASFLAPLLLRKLPDHLGAPRDLRDASTPYGYPTPLQSGGDESNLALFLDTLRTEGRRVGLVTAFFRLHPLIPLPAAVLGRYGQCRLHGQTVYVDLTKPPEQLWSETRNDHKRQIRKLEQAGYSARMDDWSVMPTFIELYAETMGRLGASDFYRFRDDYFQGLRNALGPHLHLCSVFAPDGAVAAAALVTEKGGLVQYHLAASSGAHLKMAPTKLMLHFVRHWAKDAGAHTLHLGGGVGGNADSLFLFKAGFSPTTTPFHSYRMVLDEERYDELSRAWSPPRPAAVDGGYFPTYRMAR